jgi:hypothetical protein
MSLQLLAPLQTDPVHQNAGGRRTLLTRARPANAIKEMRLPASRCANAMSSNAKARQLGIGKSETVSGGQTCNRQTPIVVHRRHSINPSVYAAIRVSWERTWPPGGQSGWQE